MQDSRRLSLIVGAFFIVSLMALGVAVLSLTSESGLFARHYRIYGNFDNVQGLLPGAPIWMAGKEVGRVRAVEFTDFGSNQPILVSMRINTSIQNRLRTDSVATIGTIGVLGDSYIEIRPGSPEGSVLIDGETIQTLSPTNLYAALAQGSEALDSISALARNLNLVVSDVREVGVIPKAASAVSAASGIVLEVESGSGLLHSVIYDNYAGGGVESIESSLASLENILEEVRTGRGILNSLIYADDVSDDATHGANSAADIQQALASLADIMREIESGDGMLHSLIYDPETGRMSEDAAAAMGRLDEILKKIEDSDGSLGLMISDPKLYEDLTQLIGGAQRSAIVRTLVRMATEE
jgi:phospholipid/cholesterol/gamma-HCH transport system substrate-binding protein